MSSIVARLWTGLLAVVVVSAHAWAQQPPEGPPLPVWGPNGFVHALARVGNTLFVGGEFDYAGPPTGGFVSVAANDATAVSAPSASILGPVQALTADGSGGWFVVEPPPFASDATAQIVHVRPDGSRDTAWVSPAFAPVTASQQASIYSLAVEQGRLFVSGAFAAVNGTARTGLAALDVGTGSLLSWNVVIEGAPTTSIAVAIGAVTPERVYLTGLFSSVNGIARAGNAAVDPVTGALSPFDSGFATTVVSATATAVYARCMTGLCAYDLTGSPLAAWSSPVAVGHQGPVAVTPTALYTTVAEGPAQRLIAVDPGTGAALGWTGPLLSGAGAAAIRPAGGRLYLAGDFTAVNAAPRRFVAALDEATGALLPWAPSPGALVYTIAVQGDRVALGGHFNSVGGASRRNLVAIDLTTGRPLPAPEPDFPVWALHAIGDIVVAAGGAGPSGRAMAFSASSGAAFPWGLATNGTIYALSSTSRYLFLAGSFIAAEGQPRNGVAAVDLTTAALSPLDQGSVSGPLAMTVSNDVVYASGNVPIPGRNQPLVVALDANTLERRPFAPSPAPGLTAAFAFAPGRVLLVGSMAQGPQQAGWFDAASGQSQPRASIQSFLGGRAAQMGSTVIVSGTVQPGLRPAVELIDTATDASAPWDPGLADGLYTSITAIHSADDFVVLGGSFDRVGGVPVANVAVFRAPRAGAPRQLTASVAGQTVTLGWRPGPAPAATAFVVEAGTAAGGSDIGRFPVGGATSVAGALPNGRYFIRVRGVGASGEGPPSSEAIVDVPVTAQPPQAPGALSASVTGTVVSFAWGAAAGNATGYLIEAGTASGLANLVVLPTGNLDTTFATPAPSGTYYVRVRAQNAFGAGPSTHEVVVVVP